MWAEGGEASGGGAGGLPTLYANYLHLWIDSMVSHPAFMIPMMLMCISQWALHESIGKGKLLVCAECACPPQHIHCSINV